MSSSTITPNADTDEATLINVFTVDPGRHTELIDALGRATDGLFTTAAGFTSANLHASLDGGRVVNDAQWASMEHFQAALERPDILECAAIATSYDPVLARVTSVHGPESDQRPTDA